MKTGVKVLLALFGVLAILGVGTNAVSAAGTVSINEFVSHPLSGETDWIELYNGSSEAVGLAGWYLRDTAASNLKTFGTADSIPAGGFLVVSVGSRLGNTGDTIELYSPSGVEDNIAYPAMVPAPPQGQSAGRASDGNGPFTVFAQPTKGSSNNPVVSEPTYGEIRVHAVREINDNGFPDFSQGEPHQAGIPVRVYNDLWQLVNTGATTGKYYNKSLRFTLETGEYYICAPLLDGYVQSFAKTITGWYSVADTSLVNASGAQDEYRSCIAVAVAQDAITSHVFGLQLLDEPLL